MAEGAWRIVAERRLVFSRRQFPIEPKESDEIRFEFVLDREVEAALVYGRIERYPRWYGWRIARVSFRLRIVRGEQLGWGKSVYCVLPRSDYDGQASGASQADLISLSMV